MNESISVHGERDDSRSLPYAARRSVSIEEVFIKAGFEKQIVHITGHGLGHPPNTERNLGGKIGIIRRSMGKGAFFPEA
jgi:hypothetical protein